jgi:hypothetical protein
MGIIIKKTTKDKNNLLGRRVVESQSYGFGNPTTTKRDVYNKKGELIKSKSISRGEDGVTKSKTNASGNTRSVNKPLDYRETRLEKRVNKGEEITMKNGGTLKKKGGAVKRKK